LGLRPDLGAAVYVIDIPDYKIVTPPYRLEKIELKQYCYALRLTMSDG